MYKITITALLFWITCFWSVVQADECFVLYKAKKDKPLKLHLGLLLIDRACSDNEVEVITRQRLYLARWSLLQIVNMSDTNEENKLKSDLGEYFLKY